MARIRLLHWKAAEARPILNLLKAAGHSVDYDEQYQTELIRQWRAQPPDAFVIDLSRLPSHGREIAIALRQSPATRFVPLIFCQGETSKIAALRAKLPDASYCVLCDLNTAIAAALNPPPGNGAAPPKIVPLNMMDRYAGRSAAHKLGIKTGFRVSLLHPPRNSRNVLGNVPEDVTFEEDVAVEENPSREVTLCFVDEPDALRATLSAVRHRASSTKL